MTQFVDTQTGEIIEGSRADYWAGRLNEGAEKSAAAILDWASDVCEALTECTEEELAPKLRFSRQTINKLREIGNQRPRFAHMCARLPASWGTLYEFTKLDDDQWATAEIGGGKGGLPLLRPDVERKEITYFRNYKQRGVAQSAPAFPAGQFSVIYADPPWQYDFSKSDSREIENQYPTLTVDEICALKDSSGRGVDEIAAEDSVLFLWATSPKLIEAIRVVNEWGFAYKTCAVWDKDRLGMGYYFRQQHELLLVATRGTPAPPHPSDRPSSVFRISRGEHSEKPQQVREAIERTYPDVARIELFARAERDGWAFWGNQVGA